jgi:hypothetical protein
MTTYSSTEVKHLTNSGISHTLFDMAISSAFVIRFGAESFHGVAAVIDRSLRLHDGAVRNAARAVVSDRVSARARADAAAAMESGASARGGRGRTLADRGVVA